MEFAARRSESLPTGGTMRARARAVAVTILAILAGCQVASNPAEPTPNSRERAANSSTVPGQYIVVFHDDVADPAALARDLVTRAGGSLLHVYTSAIKDRKSTRLNSSH